MDSRQYEAFVTKVNIPGAKAISLSDHLQCVASLAAKSELIQTLLRLGESSQDFKITPSSDCDLLVEHKIIDAKYFGVVSEEKLKKTYRAKMWLDEGSKEVKYQEILEDQSRSVGVLPAPKLEFSKSFFKGKSLFQKEKSIAFGFKRPLDPTSLGKVYDYSFDVEKVRRPIRQAVEGAGWKFTQIILS